MSTILTKFEEGEKLAARAEATLINSLLAKAKSVYDGITKIETGMLRDRDGLLLFAWQLGQLLDQMKEEIGHGKWMIWLPANFKELGPNDDQRINNAARCMKLFRENQNARIFPTSNSRNSMNLAVKVGASELFTDESVRKFMWGYIPEKERPELEGNRKLKAGAHYLSFVNHFAKFDRQVRVGLIPMPPLELFRSECEPTLRRIIEIGGKEWILSLL